MTPPPPPPRHYSVRELLDAARDVPVRPRRLTRGLTTGDGLAFAVGLSLAIIGGGAAWLVSDHAANPPCAAGMGRWQGEALTEGQPRPIAP